MAGEEFLPWSAQAFQYDHSEGPPMVIYFQRRLDVVKAGNEVQVKYRDRTFYNLPPNKELHDLSSEPPKPIPVAPSAGSDGNETHQSSSSLVSIAPPTFVPPTSASGYNILDIVEGRLFEEPQASRFGTKLVENSKAHQDGKKKSSGVIRSFMDFAFKPLKSRNPKHSGRVAPEDHPSNVQGRSTNPPDPIKSWNRDKFQGMYQNNCKYALILGITNEFNPSGIWVYEDLYNDSEDSEESEESEY